MNSILNWFKQNTKKIGLLVGGILLAALVGYAVFSFMHIRNLNAAHAQQVVEAHNQIAALSQTIQENATTASRLAQENDAQMAQLQAQNHDLADIIQSRNEQIASLTQVIANFHPIHIVADGTHATETTVTEGATTRSRVDFDQTHSDYLRVTGHTLTNPSEATIDIAFTRPLHLTVTSTQTPDGEWRTYATSDYEDLQIGQIDSSINPHVAAQSLTERQHHWYDGFEVSVNGAIGTSGHAGGLGLGIGYDFGPASIEVTGMGLVTPSGGDLLLGLRAEMNPFDL